MAPRKPWRAPAIEDGGERLLTPRRLKAVGAKLETLRRKCETMKGDELDHHLQAALIFCAARPLPDWLFTLLLKRLGRQPTADEIRWHVARKAREEGLTWDTRTFYNADGKVVRTVDGVWDTVSERLAGTFAAGSSRTMRHSYGKVESTLRSKGLGRPRTYRRQPLRQR
jgi:hypothetical protein